MKKKADVSTSAEAFDERDFEIHILRDAGERPEVVCCKMPTGK